MPFWARISTTRRSGMPEKSGTEWTSTALAAAGLDWAMARISWSALDGPPDPAAPADPDDAAAPAGVSAPVE